MRSPREAECAARLLLRIQVRHTLGRDDRTGHVPFLLGSSRRHRRPRLGFKELGRLAECLRHREFWPMMFMMSV